MGAGSAAPALIAPLVAEAVARGVRPPVRLIDVDARGWVIVARGPASRAGDALVLDEFGDLWWARAEGRGSARVTRGCWPEEIPAYVDQIRRAMGDALRAAQK